MFLCDRHIIIVDMRIRQRTGELNRNIDKPGGLYRKIERPGGIYGNIKKPGELHTGLDRPGLYGIVAGEVEICKITVLPCLTMLTQEEDFTSTQQKPPHLNMENQPPISRPGI